MSIKPIFHRQDELNTIVEIPIKSSHIPLIRSVMTFNGVPSVGPGGGHGWILGDGAIQISGSNSAVVKATSAVLFAINGPKFTTADQIYAKQKRGAMP